MIKIVMDLLLYTRNKDGKGCK